MRLPGLCAGALLCFCPSILMTIYGPSLGARLSPSSGESGCLHISGLLMGLLHMALALMESARLRLIR